jgi:hypothetical protein
MPKFTPEHLLLYLFDELADPLRPELEKALKENPALQTELHALYDGLAQLTPLSFSPDSRLLNEVLATEKINA